MAFWKNLFGGSSGQASPEPTEELDHEGYRIAASPIAEAGQYRLAATISREIDGSVHTHHLVRADLFMSAEDASAAAIRKAKQVIKEQGDAMFQDRRQ